MAEQLELLGLTLPSGFTASPPPPKRGGCGRDPKAGPGTCSHFWDGCPARVSNCYQRWMQANYEAAKDLPIDKQIEVAREAERYGWQQ